MLTLPLSQAGLTPLQLACGSRTPPLVRLLLPPGEAPPPPGDGAWYRRTAEGRTLLHLASMAGCGGTVELLLSMGMWEGAVDKAGLTPVDMALSKAVSETLERVSAIHESLGNGARAGDDVAVAKALAAGARPTRSFRGSYPLLLAAAAAGPSEDAAVAALLSADAPLAVMDAAGCTALHAAAGAGAEAALRLLLERCQQKGETGLVRLRDRAGRCPLRLAAAAGSADCVRQLLDVGAQPDEACLHAARQPECRFLVLRSLQLASEGSCVSEEVARADVEAKREAARIALLGSTWTKEVK